MIVWLKRKLRLFIASRFRFGKKGYLRKTLSKDFFKKLPDAERYYNECEKPGTVVQLSKYTDGNERELKRKNN